MGSAATKKKKKASKNNNLQRDEDAAKKSFQVRKSNLMTIAGVNTNKQKPTRQANNTRRRQIVGADDDITKMSIYSKLVCAIKQFISYVLYFLSLGYINYHPSTKQIDDIATSKQSNTVLLSTSTQHTKSNDGSNSTDTAENDNDDYYSNMSIVGLDCEMVGGGRGGYKSLLARCSVVTLDINMESPELTDEDGIPTEKKSRIQQHLLSKSPSSLDDNLIVLYDKYVIPKGGISKITDYRTQWSGITKDTYKQPSEIPIVSFQICQNEITTLFSSINSKKVIVVGHALENDFDVLEIQHPTNLIRDTALYKPYMRSVRNKKMYSRKLSHLTSEYLNIEIQQPQQPKKESSSTATSIGHSSVEDAAAALRLYWINANEWERSLGYPLSTKAQQSCQTAWNPIKLYLDGCNLPIGIRSGDGINFNDLLKETTSTNNITTISTDTIRLTSRKRDNNHPPNSISTIDWIPIFQSALSPNCTPKLKGISVMFDGAKFGNNNRRSGSSSVQQTGDSFDTRVFALESKDDSGQILIEITEKGVLADDVLFHKCLDLSSLPSSSRRVITLSQVIEILSNNINNGDNDTLQTYIVIRRKAGGSKTHRRLFDKLHLRRPNEGALCLSALTAGLQKHSLRIAKELQRERGSVERVIECELRDRSSVTNTVVTDDVYLTDRLVKNGVLVLSYKQLSCMWL